MPHENLSREEHVEGSSDRTFGLVFAGFFAIIAAWPLIASGAPRWWAAGTAAAFALVALAAPRVLAPLNRWWMKLGLLLGRIVSPIALGILFYGVFTPIGGLMRLAGKDPLKLRRDPQAASYWTVRQPPGPRRDSMNQQF